MAALETIRTKFGIGASLIIAFGLLLFLVNPSDIIQTIQSASTKYDVGKINGKRVTYTDFDQEVKKYTEIREMLTGTSVSSEQAQRETREMTWQELVNENLIVPTIEDAGIHVGKDEQVDMIIGEHLSPVITSMGLFVDENGNFSPEAVSQFMENTATDERGLLLRNYILNTVRTNRYTEKYAGLFTAASYVNSLELRNAISENNTTASVSFVMSPNSYYTQDTTVVISSAEIKKYYDAHKENFRQQATRDIEYAVFEVTPSASDIDAENNEFVQLYDEFAASDNVRAFLQRNNSERAWSDNWVKDGELRSVNRDIDAFVSANNEGTSPIYKSGITFYAARIMELANVPDSVYVRHIMLGGADARHVADSLLKVVNKNNFAALATEYSLDTRNAADGEQGNLGWMTQNAMIPGFESVITAKVGQPYVITTQYGVHVVEVTKTTTPLAKKKVAIFEKSAIPSKETYAATYNKANKLAVAANGKYAGYKAACDSTGIYSRSLKINEGTDTYGSIGHAKEVTRWAFDNKPGKASGIITIDNNYFFVVAVKEAHKEGIAALSEVSDNIRTQLYREKYSEKRAAEVAAKIEGLNSLDAIAEALGASVSNLTDVTFSTSSAATTEPAFVGAVAAAKEGEISGPVAGIMGTYVFQVNGRETGAYYTEDDAQAAQARIDSYHDQMLMPLMTEKKVTDNRARFY